MSPLAQFYYRRLRDAGVDDNGWFVFADALEVAGERRLARRITRFIWRARRFERAYSQQPRRVASIARNHAQEQLERDGVALHWAIEDVFGYA